MLLLLGKVLYRTGDDEDSSSDKDAEKDSDVRTDQFIDENNNGIDDRDENTEELNFKSKSSTWLAIHRHKQRNCIYYYVLES
jgi:hypothetical protein